MKVKDIMTKGVVTVNKDFSIYEVAEVIARYGISGVAVIGEEGSLDGTISERDIIRAIAEKEDISKLCAGDIMMPCAITVSPEMDIKEVLELMWEENVHRLFVCIDEKITPARVGSRYRQRPVGIIAASDLVRQLSRG
ncbi:MAG: CBS domain-containing protein [Methanobacteriota archaeon]